MLLTLGPLYEVPSSDSWATQALLPIFWSFKLLGRVQPRQFLKRFDGVSKTTPP